jgi:hypothetical protein
LKEQGLIGKPAAPVLLVNGDHDSQVPIADLDLMLHAGSAKEAWVNPGGGHMGRSAEWPDRRFSVRWWRPGSPGRSGRTGGTIDPGPPESRLHSPITDF